MKRSWWLAVASLVVTGLLVLSGCGDASSSSGARLATGPCRGLTLTGGEVGCVTVTQAHCYPRGLQTNGGTIDPADDIQVIGSFPGFQNVNLTLTATSVTLTLLGQQFANLSGGAPKNFDVKSGADLDTDLTGNRASRTHIAGHVSCS